MILPGNNRKFVKFVKNGFSSQICQNPGFFCQYFDLEMKFIEILGACDVCVFVSMCSGGGGDALNRP